MFYTSHPWPTPSGPYNVCNLALGLKNTRLPCQWVLPPSPGLPSVAQACALFPPDLITMTEWSEQLPAFRLDPGSIFGCMLWRPWPSSQSSPEHRHQARLSSFLFPKEHPECGTISLSIISKLALGL